MLGECTNGGPPQDSVSALRRPRGDCQEGRHLSCKTFLATPPSPRFGWVRSWHRCRCASIGVDHPPLSSRPDAGAPASASITPPYHQGPMQARQHRCRVLVLWVLSRVCCVILFSDSVVTRPGNGGVFRKLLQDRCRHFWQSRGICPNALIHPVLASLLRRGRRATGLS